MSDVFEDMTTVLPANVWVGTTAEDQKRADERIPHLLSVPAAVRFLSCEPLLGAIDLPSACEAITQISVDWVIVGGESGPGSRLMVPAWARTIILDCQAAGVPVFMKQTGAVLAREWKLRDTHKGGDPDEWPEWMRVREFPTPHHV